MKSTGAKSTSANWGKVDHFFVSKSGKANGISPLGATVLPVGLKDDSKYMLTPSQCAEINSTAVWTVAPIIIHVKRVTMHSYPG